MNFADYQRATKLLAARGLTIEKQEYREEAFGSWYLVSSSHPPRRIVWDGKEGSYVVEEETAERFNGLSVWRELWIKRRATARSLEEAVDALLSK